MSLFSLPDLGSAILGLAKGWLEGNQKITQAKLQAKIVTIESAARIAEAKSTAFVNLAASEQDHAQAWERILVEQSYSSWKDEFWTLWVAIPISAMFIPYLAPYVRQGFVELETVPEWYLYILFAAVSFAFARRELLPVLKGLRKPK
jgi:hypothetical protein